MIDTPTQCTVREISCEIGPIQSLNYTSEECIRLVKDEGTPQEQSTPGRMLIYGHICFGGPIPLDNFPEHFLYNRCKDHYEFVKPLTIIMQDFSVVYVDPEKSPAIISKELLETIIIKRVFVQIDTYWMLNGVNVVAPNHHYEFVAHCEAQ